MLSNILDKILKRHKKKEPEKLICQRCKKEINEPSYILVSGAIISNNLSARVFTCPEQAFNYNQRIVMHATCWIDTIREYGSPLYDMGKVYEEYKKKKRGKNFNELK